MLSRLILTDFRNYARLDWTPEARMAVLTGPNGSGKTNLLEAVSLLAPGRGLRGARIADLARTGGSGRWAVAARVGEHELGTGTLGDGPPERRQWRLNGVDLRSQAELAQIFAAVWLTPQMDGLFGESASGRRRFLDRLVWALEPGHAREAAAYDTAMASRNRLLAGRGADPSWLAGLEASMARHAVALAASRQGFVARLNAAALPASAFPRARLRLLDPIAGRLGEEPALSVETWLRASLAGRREEDARAGGAGLGAHRADLAIEDAETGLPAPLASTGQQKALLTGIILAHASLVRDARTVPPVLLLDEPLVHLDENRRAALLQSVAAMDGQVLMTGTDAEVFASLRGQAGFWRAGEGGLRPG